MNNEIQRIAIPWEQRAEIGFFKAFFQTIKEVLFRPAAFFSNVDADRPLWEPFTFLFILAVLIQLCGLLMIKLFMPALKGNLIFSLSIFSILITPFITAFGLSGIIHVFVLLFKGQGRFRGTFTAVNYGYGVMVVSVIPLLGGIAGAIWYSIVIVKGLAHIHKYSIGKAALSLIIPVLLLTGFLTYSDLRNPKNSIRETWKKSSEMNALSSLLIIQFAQADWRLNHARFVPDLSTLANAQPPHIDKELRSGTLRGYTFFISEANDKGFVAIANPVSRGNSVIRSFCVAEDGKIHYQEHDDYSATTSVCTGLLLEEPGKGQGAPLR